MQNYVIIIAKTVESNAKTASYYKRHILTVHSNTNPKDDNNIQNANYTEQINYMIMKPIALKFYTDAQRKVYVMCKIQFMSKLAPLATYGRQNSMHL